MSRRAGPTTTHHAILGMLAIRPYSPYELAKQFDRSLGRFWPRAHSKLFEAPKQLVEMGLARAAAESNGKRRRTVYSITPKGRRALRTWLHEPGSGPEIEFEQLMKVFFAEHGTKAAALTNIEAASAWADAQLEHHLEVGSSYSEERGPFQERAAQLVLTGTFLTEFALLVERWAGWARQVVERWPDDPSKADPDLQSLRDLTRRLQRRLGARRKRA